MPFDILLIIDQIKKFLKNEKGTVLSLLAILLIEFIIYNYVYNTIKIYLTIPFIRYYLYLVALTVVIWLYHRHIWTSRLKTNIGITRFEVINTDLKNVITGEVKYSVAEELDQYIYNRLLLDNHFIDARKYLNIILLPPRFNTERDRPYKYRKYRFLDFLVSGAVYIDTVKTAITPNFIFINDLPTNLFHEIKDDLITDKKFEYKFDGSPNLEFDKILHGLTYIGLVYCCAKFAHYKLYEKADTLSQEIKENIEKLYKSSDQSVNQGDVDFLKIEALLYFLQAKNLHKWGNYLLFDKSQVAEAKVKFDEAAKILVKSTDLLKLLKTNTQDLVDDSIVDHRFIYAVGLLAKEGDKKVAKRILSKVKAEISNEENYLLAQALYAERLNEELAAKNKYLKILKADPKNKYALRRIISIYFREEEFDLCYRSIKQYYSITFKHVYDQSFFDLRVCQRMVLSSIMTFRYYSALKYVFLFVFFSLYNFFELRKSTVF